MIVIKALNMAAEAHRDQERRGTKLPYIIHPVTVAFLLGKYKISKKLPEMTVACILHDCPEDTKLTIAKIADEFGPLVSGMVFELTNDPEEMATYGSKNEYLVQKLVHISSYSLTLKLCDRFGNILDGPTENYVSDTIVLLEYVLENRKLSDTQQTIVADILVTCDEFLEKLDD